MKILAIGDVVGPCAIEYMENHLTDDITLGDIAESVSISSFHFQP